MPIPIRELYDAAAAGHLNTPMAIRCLFAYMPVCGCCAEPRPVVGGFLQLDDGESVAVLVGRDGFVWHERSERALYSMCEKTKEIRNNYSIPSCKDYLGLVDGKVVRLTDKPCSDRRWIDDISYVHLMPDIFLRAIEKTAHYATAPA